MNYSETYKLLWWSAESAEWVSLGTADTESEVGAVMDSFAGNLPGRWRLVRTTEVTIREVVSVK